MKISIIYITDSNRPDVLNTCLTSSLIVADEVIVVGNTDRALKSSNIILIENKTLAKEGRISEMRNIGANKASGDIIINADDDIYFPPMFRKKLLKYVKNNPNFGSVTTKVIGVNGSRYWDKPIHVNGNSFMIDYDQTHPDLYYSGAFVIRQREFAKKYQWDCSLRYYEKEDVEYSSRIKASGNVINIDVNNYVVHLDDRYISYKNDNGYLECSKVNNIPIDSIQEKEFREIKALLWKL